MNTNTNKTTNLNQLLFMLHASWIILGELLIYCLFWNYSSFIDRLSRRLSSINMLYVKVFQAFALNNSLIDDEMNNNLLRFTDNAPWTYDDIDFDMLRNIGDEYDISFCDGINRPMNSGMISLVFKAFKNTTNESIIIKMKRNNIEERLHKAIENLEFFMYMLSFIPFIKKYQISEVITKNISVIRHQTNFNEEVENMIKMKDNCKNLKYVKIPTVYSEVTQKYPSIIMMEYIDGLTINKVKEEDYNDFAKQVLKFGFVTTIVHGVCHGDLHSGNILFIKDDDAANNKNNNNKNNKYKYKIGVLDFGIIYELDADYKSNLFEILSEMFHLPSCEIAEKFMLSGIIEPIDVVKNLPKHHYDNIIQFSSEMIEDTLRHSKKANQIQIYKFLYNFNSYLNEHQISELGLHPSDNFVKTQLTLAMAHGVTLTLCKHDYMALADQVIEELFHTNMFLHLE